MDSCIFRLGFDLGLPKGPGRLIRTFTFIISLLTLLVASLGSAQVYDVQTYGAIGDGIVDDTPAIQLAIEAAGVAGGGTVYFPCGQYRVGSTGLNRFYSGVQVTYDNITLEGESKECAELLPRFNLGGVLVAVCPGFDNSPNYGTRKDCEVGPPVQGFVMQNLGLRDDDPVAHCANYNFVPGNCVTEQTHGISISFADGALVQHNRFEALGDESVTMTSAGTIDSNSFFQHAEHPAFRRRGDRCGWSEYQYYEQSDHRNEGRSGRHRMFFVSLRKQGPSNFGGDRDGFGIEFDPDREQRRLRF